MTENTIYGANCQPFSNLLVEMLHFKSQVIGTCHVRINTLSLK